MDLLITLGDYTVAPAPTFGLPPDEERKNMKVGEYAKVSFQIPQGFPGDPNVERMWVLIQKVTAPGEYEGILNNDPVIVPMQDGDEVKFKWNNVIGTL